MKFSIEQVALYPPDPGRALQLLRALGLTDWIHDNVVAVGEVHGAPGTNAAALAFNYQSAPEPVAPLELEVLHYTAGPHWMERARPAVSHLGMHCTAEELAAWRETFARLGIEVAQEVLTQQHTNPYLLERGRKYQYVIFNTRPVLGVDLKFIVRREPSHE
jgi:hypothetical protein